MLDAGLCNYVLLTYGHSGLSGGGMAKLQEIRSRSSGDNLVFGHFGASADYALAAQRGIHTFQTGPETWKHIAVGQRKWANLNPMATMYDKKMTFEDYYKSDWVVEPLRRADSCLISDGGRALISTTAERAPDLKHPPVYILGLGHHNPSK